MNTDRSLSQAFSAPTALEARSPRYALNHGSPKPQPWALTLALVILSVGFGAMIGLPLVDGTWTEIHSQAGMAMFLGSVTGLVGTYLCLVMVILASRMPAIERMIGQSWSMHFHRRLSPWAIVLIEVHVVLVTLAYGVVAHSGIVGEFGTIVRSYPKMITATIAWVIMTVVGIVSYPTIRRWLRRESWWGLHLLLYVALILSFAHEVVLGPSFVGHPLTQWIWTGAWLVAGVLVLWYRILVPASRSLYHRIRVEEIVREAPDVVSIICSGEHLENLKVSGGQFFQWRFITREHWASAHPFTLSARPQPPYLRLTVKASGDFTSQIASIKPGTAVMIEGPYGAFHAHHQKHQKVLMIAGGIGVTAIRPLLEDLTEKNRPIVVVRASTDQDVVFRDEIAELTTKRRGEFYVLTGSRKQVKLSQITKVVSDLKRRDVFICGSESFVDAMVEELLAEGVRADSIHSEAYAL